MYITCYCLLYVSVYLLRGCQLQVFNFAEKIQRYFILCKFLYRLISEINVLLNWIELNWGIILPRQIWKPVCIECNHWSYKGGVILIRQIWKPVYIECNHLSFQGGIILPRQIWKPVYQLEHILRRIGTYSRLVIPKDPWFEFSRRTVHNAPNF